LLKAFLRYLKTVITACAKGKVAGGGFPLYVTLKRKAIGKEGLKRYVEEYKNVKYGIAIGFVYDPEGILAGEPGANKIEVVEMSEEQIIEEAMKRLMPWLRRGGNA